MSIKVLTVKDTIDFLKTLRELRYLNYKSKIYEK